MVQKINEFAKTIFLGSKTYMAWMGFLTLLILISLKFIYTQLDQGLIVTNMRDEVSWGWYIANFTFLVGVAAAAVVIVVPAYLYDNKPLKHIVLLGECMAVAAVTMCMLFVTLDMGSPERVWHLFPGPGIFNFPQSVLAWDVLVLNLYLGLNLFLLVYALLKIYQGKDYQTKFIWPFILFSIPAAISIHTVTAFIYAGMASRPFWNAAVLAPRFIASAFCSGPGFMLIAFQIIRKTTKFEIEDKALFKIAEIMAYAMAINLFLLGAEIFKELYSATAHVASLKYLYTGLHGHDQLVNWIWTAVSLNVIAFIILLVPKLRNNLTTLNLACILLFIGVYIEKGMGLVFPGFIPGTLGEIYDYFPNALEVIISLGVWAIGLITFTVLAKVAIAIKMGDLKCDCTDK